MINRYNEEFLDSKEDNFEVFIDKLNLFQSNMTKTEGVKQPKEKYNHDKFLNNYFSDKGKDTNTVFNELKYMFNGAIRPHSANACFNMVPTPLLDSIVASTYTQLYNTNSISSQFGGNVLLFEQEIARSIGKLAGWTDAYGIFCSGGKATLLYALKAAISRVCPNSLLNGISSDLVVIAQESSHYSIEHVCSILGIGSKNVIRIPACKKWEMNTIILENQIKSVINSGKKVAAIFCCGGTTINFASDNTDDVIRVVNSIYGDNKYGYTPYLHLDSVIGWLWFTFLNYKGDYHQYTNDSSIINSIEEVTKKFNGVKYFDSFGVDFHKNGLCPYSSSIFIIKSRNTLLELTDGNDTLLDIDDGRGNINAFKYTLENSRSSSGIAAAHTTLNRLGKDGFRQYLVDMLTIKGSVRLELEKFEGIEIINQQSCGWEIVFNIDFSDINIPQDIIANSFIKYAWNRADEGCPNTPLISIIPNYRQTPEELPKTLFLCYPMSLILLEKAKELAENINNLILGFKIHIKQNPQDLIDKIDAPIR